jgi:uncharacterized protein (TIRG00374 family)
LFAILFWKSGPELVGFLLLEVGWALPLVILPHGLVVISEAFGWWFAFPHGRCPIKPAGIVRFTVAAKAIQVMTPSFSQAGELLKIRFLCLSGIKPDVSVASVVAAKTTIALAELVFIGIGLTVVISILTIEPLLLTSVSAGIVVMIFFAVGILVWQRVGLFRPLIWVSRRFRILTTFFHRHEDFLSSTDCLLREYLGEGRRFALSGLGYLLGWMAGAVEAWVFLRILGLPNDPLSALLIQVWLIVVIRLTGFVPGNLGTQEAGAVMVFSFLGLTADSAMAFAVLRRIRQIVWTALGLGALAKVPGTQ